MSGWRPIETAPKDGTRILVYAGQVTLVRWLFSDRPFLCGFYDEVESRVSVPTHWMPLPEPPEPEQ